MTDPGPFYDHLAADYHLIFEDWQASVTRQAVILTAFLRSVGVPDGGAVLDCACGIGTQALGVAEAGYEVVGTDISGGALRRARREAARRGLRVVFRTADMRRLGRGLHGRFDAIWCLDNAVAHLAGIDDLHAALASMARCARPGGLVACSVRPYDQLRRERPRSSHPRVSGGRGQRRVSFQLWEWRDDASGYDLDQLVLRETGAEFAVTARHTSLTAWRRRDLVGAFAAVGLRDVSWLTPRRTGFYQPLVTGRRAA